MEKTKTTEHPYPLSGLYAITQAVSDPAVSLSRQVEQAILGGARIVQYRDKSNDEQKRLNECIPLLEICRTHHIPLIINDDVALAQEVGAHGVHLGAEDSACQQAREQLGPRAIIGISCYNQVSLAEQAQQQGADYVAFGRFFPSRTKPQAVQANLKLLQLARQTLTIPVVAIGGITAQNCQPLIDAGADMLAVIDALFGQEDIKTAAQTFRECFNGSA